MGSRKHWIENKQISINTFGNSKACQILAEMMNRDEISIPSKKKVLRFINNMIYNFQCIAAISDKGVRNNTLLIVRDIFNKNIDEIIYLDNIKCQTYLKNVVTHYFRKNLKF